MRKVSTRAVAMLGAGIALVGTAVAVTAASAGAATTGGRADYAASSQWTGGSGANVTITNLGDPVSSWTLTWSFPAGQAVTQAWNATVTQSGARVTANNASYNGSVATNGTVAFGFNGSWTGSNPVPTDFALNGTSCNDSTGSPT